MSMDRRSFLKGAAMTGIGAMTFAPIAATANEAAAENVPAYRAKPAPITDDQISETFEADVVVVGLGNAGVMATATLVENGASVIVLQKTDGVLTHGAVFAAIGSKKQKEMGVEQDGWELIGHLNRGSGVNNGKWEVMKAWLDYSGNMADYILDRYASTDLGPWIVDVAGEPSEPWNKGYSCTHIALGRKEGLGKMWTLSNQIFNDVCAEGNVDVHFETPAVQLRQDEDGRVVGVIGQQADGSYILCKATKGVILAAGGYEQNLEMRHEFLPMADGLPAGFSRPNTNMGDGILMGMWAGGLIQQGPHGSSAHYDIGGLSINGTIVPFLRVNKYGERFSNEDVAYHAIWVQDAHQPGHMHYQIFDDNYAEDVPNMGEGMTLLGDWATMIPQAVEDGYVIKADTLEELAQAIDVPVDNFVATVARYNELAEGNYDYEPDFGKLGYKVKKIAKAPFYAAPRIAYVMNTLGGLEIDGNMQVLDAEFKPIPGLFAAGNNSGCFFGGIYQDMSVPGMSVGRALLTGRVAAWRALGLVGAGEQA